MKREDLFLIERESVEPRTWTVCAGPCPATGTVPEPVFRLRKPVLAVERRTLDRMAEASARTSWASTASRLQAVNRFELARNQYLMSTDWSLNGWKLKNYFHQALERAGPAGKAGGKVTEDGTAQIGETGRSGRA